MKTMPPPVYRPGEPLPPPPVAATPSSPPKVGDIFYRAHGSVFVRGDDELSVHVSYEEFVVLSTTRCMMRIAARRGLLQSWEGLPGQEGLGNDYILLTPEQLADRLEGCETRVSGHNSQVMFAWPTRELALESLKIRTRKRVLHRQRDLDHVLTLQHHLEACSDPDAPGTAWGQFTPTRRT